MRKGAPQAISHVLQDVVKGWEQAKKSDIAQISSQWGALAGRSFSKHTKPMGLKRGTLWVNVENSAWFYQANLEKERLLKSLQKKLGAKKVQRIQLRMGDVS